MRSAGYPPPHRHPLLNAFSGIDFRRVEVLETVGCDIVHPLELAGLPAAVTEGTHHFQGVAFEDPDFLVAPSAANSHRCSGSRENSMSQDEPLATDGPGGEAAFHEE